MTGGRILGLPQAAAAAWGVCPFPLDDLVGLALLPAHAKKHAPCFTVGGCGSPFTIGHAAPCLKIPLTFPRLTQIANVLEVIREFQTSGKHASNREAAQ